MRVPEWQRILSAYVLESQERYKREGFAFGRWDCCTFVGEWVRRATGVDHLAAYKGRYATDVEALTVLSETDGSIRQALHTRFGDSVHPSLAQRGDIAYARFGGRECLGIFFTSGARMRAVFLGEGGFAFHRANNAELAFRVV